jgi:hypothetical protein
MNKNNLGYTIQQTLTTRKILILLAIRTKKMKITRMNFPQIGITKLFKKLRLKEKMK